MLHLEGKLFESRRYRVDTDEFMTPLPEGWSIRSTVWSIVLGEREDDSFLVINLSGKVVQYNLISKTLREIYDMRSNQVADDYLDGFIPPFAIYDMGSKIVDHKVYEFIPSYKCKKFYWYDPELDNEWYRRHLYGMYGQLNPHQIQDIATEISSHEQLICPPDEFAGIDVN
ncbi:hypothetical protein Tco_0178830 [Tanacetum coccineum]